MGSVETFNTSIVTARNLGIEKRAREAASFTIEDFLLKLMELYGLNKSDIANLAIERYLRDQGYLTLESLTLINSVTDKEKKIFIEGIL